MQFSITIQLQLFYFIFKKKTQKESLIKKKKKLKYNNLLNEETEFAEVDQAQSRNQNKVADLLAKKKQIWN